MAEVLGDIIGDSCRVLICGMAVGNRSSRTGHYYAARSNRFWRMLNAAGLTPVTLSSERDTDLPRYGIGLTDISKTGRGMDYAVVPTASDPKRLVELVALAKPSVLVFNGRAPAMVVAAHLGVDKPGIVFGRQRSGWPGFPPVVVVPSTSGTNTRYRGDTEVGYWREVAQTLRKAEK